MFVDQFYIDCLSQASYLVGDETSRQAVLIDPRRDIAEFVDAAADRGVTIVGVVNTHFHADFVAGHLELRDALGTWIAYGSAAETDYPIRRLADGETIRLGGLTLTALHTPGHTWESISLVAGDADTPVAVFTGDCLFVGDIGRPDLAAAVGADPIELAHAQFRSVQQVLGSLADDLVVYPAHGAGSSCGKNISTDLQSTIGGERVTNWAFLEQDETRFVDQLLSGQPAVPAYFGIDAMLNRQVRPVQVAPPRPRKLTATEALDRRDDGAHIIDTRDPEVFARSHLTGAINIGLDGRLAETAGMIFTPEHQLIIIAPDQRQDEAALRLGRIGLDAVVGYLDDQEAEAELPDLVTSTHRIDATEFDRARSATAPVIVDVRNSGELAAGVIPGSVHIPLAELPQRLAEIPADQPVIVHCGSGWRSSVASSLIAADGHDAVTDLRGGYQAWHGHSRPRA